MKTIHKFEIKPDDIIKIEMPKDAEILTVQTQFGHPNIWAVVDDANPKVIRRFKIFGTGHIINEILVCMKYIGTFQLHGGELVYHLFELKGE